MNANIDIRNVNQAIRDKAELDTPLTDLFRTFGEWIYILLDSLMGYCESGFKALSQFDIMSLDSVQKISQGMKTLLYSLLFIAFIVVVIIRMFKLENQFKTIYNVVMVLLFISIFASTLTLMNTLKIGVMKEIDVLFGKQENTTVSSMLYKSNTVDILKSLDKNKLVYLSDIESYNMKYHDSSIRLTKNQLGEKIVGVKSNGELEVEKISDGLFGVGDIRYYRYRTDYVALNITLAISIVVYILAMFKIGYLIWQWLQINIFGQLAMSKGFMELSHVGSTFKSAFLTLCGVCVLYFSMNFFSILSSNILNDNVLSSNWLLKGILLFSIGISIIIGTGYLNNELGIDDGSQFGIKSIFMAQRLGHLGKGLVNGAKDTVANVGGAVNKTGEGLANFDEILHKRTQYSTMDTGRYDDVYSKINEPKIGISANNGGNTNVDTDNEENRTKEIVDKNIIYGDDKYSRSHGNKLKSNENRMITKPNGFTYEESPQSYKMRLSENEYSSGSESRLNLNENNNAKKEQFNSKINGKIAYMQNENSEVVGNKSHKTSMQVQEEKSNSTRGKESTNSFDKDNNTCKSEYGGKNKENSSYKKTRTSSPYAETQKRNMQKVNQTPIRKQRVRKKDINEYDSMFEELEDSVEVSNGISSNSKNRNRGKF